MDKINKYLYGNKIYDFLEEFKYEDDKWFNFDDDNEYENNHIPDNKKKIKIDDDGSLELLLEYSKLDDIEDICFGDNFSNLEYFIERFSKNLKNLKKIEFGKFFGVFCNEEDEILEHGDIPDGVEYLIFGKYFKQKLTNEILPKNLKILVIDIKYPHKLENIECIVLYNYITMNYDDDYDKEDYYEESEYEKNNGKNYHINNINNMIEYVKQNEFLWKKKNEINRELLEKVLNPLRLLDKMKNNNLNFEDLIELN